MSKVVILGTAHGSNVAGKRSPDGRLREYAYSRDICRRVQAGLQAKGVKVFIDIPEDIEQSLNGRVRRVNALCAQYGGAGNCIYVSIHNNAAGADGKWHTARGFCVYCYTSGSSASKALAGTFAKHAKELNLKGNRAWPTTQYYTAGFAVLRDTICPAVLTENLFQDNEDDVDFLLSDEGKAKITQLHVEAICEYLGVK